MAYGFKTLQTACWVICSPRGRRFDHSSADDGAHAGLGEDVFREMKLVAGNDILAQGIHDCFYDFIAGSCGNAVFECLECLPDVRGNGGVSRQDLPQLL